MAATCRLRPKEDDSVTSRDTGDGIVGLRAATTQLGEGINRLLDVHVAMKRGQPGTVAHRREPRRLEAWARRENQVILRLHERRYVFRIDSTWNRRRAP